MALGPMAPPGVYSVRLTADDRSDIRPLVVRSHPSAGRVTDADIQARFSLAMEIRELTSQVHRIVLVLRALGTELDDRLGPSRAPQVVAAGHVLRNKILEIESRLNKGAVPSVSGMPPLNDRLLVLHQRVEGNYGSGLEGDRADLVRLAAEFAQHLSGLHDVLTDDLPRFNLVLQRYRREPIPIPELKLSR
jgi:hypothetical protein